MKISNFVLVEVLGNSYQTYLFKATIDIETGFLFWKKKRTVEIFKSWFHSYWRLSKTGAYTSGTQVEDLCKAYCARQGKELEHCK